MLSSHPDLAIPGESHFIPTSFRERSRFERQDGFDHRAFVEFHLAQPRVQSWNLTPDSVHDLFDDARPRSVPEGVRLLYRAYADHRGKVRYGDKTPAYILRLDLLSMAFPESRFVHIIRDGRDVCLSLQEMEWGPDDVYEAARFWRHRVERGIASGRALGPSRYLEVRYEDLVDGPEECLKRVCAFLDLGFREEMLSYSVHSEALLGETLAPHRHQGVRAPIEGRTRDWSTQMSPKDIALFERVAGRLLSNLGYPSAQHILPSARAGAVWKAFRMDVLWPLRGLTKRVKSGIGARVRGRDA